MYTSANVKIEFDNATGTLQDMSQYITEFNGINIEAMLQESHAFGDAWVERLFAGVKQIGDITLKGFYDDTATTGPNAIFNDVGNTGTSAPGTRELKITWDLANNGIGSGAKTTLVNTIIKSYARVPSRGALTMFEVVLAVTGSPTEA